MRGSRRLKKIICQIMLVRNRNITLGRNSSFGRGTVFFAPHKITIGHDSYIGKYCTLETDITIGNGVAIGNNVGLIGKYDHDYSNIGTYLNNSPWINDEKYDFHGKGLSINIGDDVWIGYGSIVFSGVSIGRGAIVGAGSVVTKDIEPYSIVVGNPAQKVGERFTKEEIVKHEAVLY